MSGLAGLLHPPERTVLHPRYHPLHPFKLIQLVLLLSLQCMALCGLSLLFFPLPFELGVVIL